MTERQKENSCKYLYDISKGIFLVAVVGNLMKENWDIPFIFFGILAALIFFVWAYILDGGDENE